MNKLLFITLLLTMLFASPLESKEEIPAFPFSLLNYNEEYCAPLGVYHRWVPNSLSGKIKSPLFNLDSFSLQKDNNKIHFNNDARYTSDALGSFDFSFYDFKNKQLAVIMSDDFINNVKSRRSEEIASQIGKYFIFRLVRLDYRPDVDKLQCGIQVASCKNQKDADLIINRRFSLYNFPAASNCMNCICQYYDRFPDKEF